MAFFLRVLGFLEWHRSAGFPLKSPAARAPHRRVSLPFEALKLEIDFSLVVKVLDGIFQGKAVSSTLKSDVACGRLHDFSELDLLENLLQFLRQRLLLQLALRSVQTTSFLKPCESISASVRLSSVAPSPL